MHIEFGSWRILEFLSVLRYWPSNFTVGKSQTQGTAVTGPGSPGPQPRVLFPTPRKSLAFWCYLDDHRAVSGTPIRKDRNQASFTWEKCPFPWFFSELSHARICVLDQNFILRAIVCVPIQWLSTVCGKFTYLLFISLHLFLPLCSPHPHPHTCKHSLVQKFCSEQRRPNSSPHEALYSHLGTHTTKE